MKRLIALATGLLAALARHGGTGAGRQATCTASGRLLRLGGRRRRRVRQPRRADATGQRGPRGRERAEGAEPVRRPTRRCRDSAKGKARREVPRDACRSGST